MSWGMKEVNFVLKFVVDGKIYAEGGTLLYDGLGLN
jgi:hypothetical protein